MSILTDFYNLDLALTEITEPDWCTPKADRPKILEFFEKHAQKVLKYTTAAEIAEAKKPMGAEIIGTLGYFEHRRKQSWFEKDAFNFYVDFKRLRELVDFYLEAKLRGTKPNEIPDHINAWIKSLLNNVRLGVHRIEGKNGKVSFKEHITTITSTSADPLKVVVDLGKMRYQLCREIISVLNGETEIRRCESEDCNKIFIPTPRGKEQRYCSMRCRKRSYGREYREKNC